MNYCMIRKQYYAMVNLTDNVMGFGPNKILDIRDRTMTRKYFLGPWF